MDNYICETYIFHRDNARLYKLISAKQFLIYMFFPLDLRFWSKEKVDQLVFFQHFAFSFRVSGNQDDNKDEKAFLHTNLCSDNIIKFVYIYSIESYLIF